MSTINFGESAKSSHPYLRYLAGSGQLREAGGPAAGPKKFRKPFILNHENIVAFVRYILKNPRASHVPDIEFFFSPTDKKLVIALQPSRRDEIEASFYFGHTFKGALLVRADRASATISFRISVVQYSSKKVKMVATHLFKLLQQRDIVSDISRDQVAYIVSFKRPRSFERAT